MKLSTNLTKGLTEEQQKTLEREVKSSVLAKQLRKRLRELHLETLSAEENTESEIELYRLIGQRRGFRRVLNLLPEE